MRKLVTIICAFIISTASFAQKNEMKAAEKAIKSGSYDQAESSIMAAEALLPNMDDKTKDKFYYLKAQALYAGGQISGDDIDNAIQAVNDLEALKQKTGKSKYLEDALGIKNNIFSSVANSAQNAFTAKNYEVAAVNYLKAYNLSKKDTLFLYGAATAYLNAQNFEKSLPIYEQLLDMNYEGSGIVYTAIVKETGAKETFGDKMLRDAAVKSGKYLSPKDEKLPSKKGEVLRYMALIYSNQNKGEKALELIEEAKTYNPEDIQLVIAEAKAYLALDQKDKIKPLLDGSNSLLKEDPQNLMNFGIFAMEIGENDMAMDYFERTIKVNPKYAGAYLNIGNLIVSQEEAIVEQMNKLGNSAADNAKYDELRDKKTQVLMDAIPYLEKSFELEPRTDTGKFLLSVYNASFQNKKAKEFKAKMESLGL